jgi:threonine synthase
MALAYVSTRGGTSGGTSGGPSGSLAPQTFSSVALDGLAADGGLMLPAQLPSIDQARLSAWRSLDYVGLALEVMGLFVDDLGPGDLERLITKTYTSEVFGSRDITPCSRLQPDLSLLHLSNGPTLAFKDIAMQWLGHLFEHLLGREGATLNILGATSGDTGSAALHAMKGKAGIEVFMLSPYQRMSPFQAAQMYSVQDRNCHNLAIRGVFDEAQDIVKQLSQDAPFKSRWRLGSVNSINWARLVAQVVYYFKGYFAATSSNSERVSFCVPSGNFGNIYAGHVARRMGLPIDRLICATNENDVLNEFFQSGVYRARPKHEVHATSSPSMDISRASNFERLMFDLHEGDAERVRHDWNALATTGCFTLSPAELAKAIDHFGFLSGASSHAERIATIKDVHRRFGIFIDPHTADGFAVAAKIKVDTPVVVLETALPAKFEGTMREALGVVPQRPAAFVGLEQLPQRYKVIDASADAVRAEIISTASQRQPAGAQAQVH